MACEFYYDDDRWKRGTTEKDYLAKDIYIPINYFSCGTYFFDGLYNVVKFPAGMKLYHGSYPLFETNSEFPLGKDFYDPVKPYAIPPDFSEKVDESENSVEEELTEYDPPSIGWFSDPRTASMYSDQSDTYKACRGECISTYVLKRDAVFVLLDHPNNLMRFRNEATLKADSKLLEAINYMFSLKDEPVKWDTYDRVRLNTERNSHRFHDTVFAEWFCKEFNGPKSNFRGHYAGYAANVQLNRFHMEFVFCDQPKWLKRDLTDEVDLQHNSKLNETPEIVMDLLKQMSLYKSTNVNFHAGDLLQHSIWSLLFAEEVTKRDTVAKFTNYSPSEEVRKRIAAIAFIHDIGKMAPSFTKIRKHDMTYFAIKEHPTIGADYIMEIESLPTFDANLKFVKNFNVPELLLALGLDNHVRETAKIIQYHWDFGDHLRRISIGSQINEIADSYIALIGPTESVEFFFSILMVSCADIFASQPFSVNLKTNHKNPHSEFFPYIANVPRKYKGGLVATNSIDRFGWKLMEKIMTKVSGVSFVLQPIVSESTVLYNQIYALRPLRFRLLEPNLKGVSGKFDAQFFDLKKKYESLTPILENFLKEGRFIMADILRIQIEKIRLDALKVEYKALMARGMKADALSAKTQAQQLFEELWEIQNKTSSVNK